MKESKIIKTFPRFVDDTPISSPGCEYQFGIFPSGKGCFASYTKCANGVPSEVSSQIIPFSQLELPLWLRCTASWVLPTTTGSTPATGLTCSWSTPVRHSFGWNCFQTIVLTTLSNIIFAGCDPGAALGDFRWILTPPPTPVQCRNENWYMSKPNVEKMSVTDGTPAKRIEKLNNSKKKNC